MALHDVVVITLSVMIGLCVCARDSPVPLQRVFGKRPFLHSDWLTAVPDLAEMFASELPATQICTATLGPSDYVGH